jgi:hypothetical protein
MPTIQVKRGLAARWTATNPTLLEGEVGFETDTGKYKVGGKFDKDGVLQNTNQSWTNLGYAKSGGSATLNVPLTISSAFKNGSTTFSGSTAYTLDLPDTIQKNAITATSLLNSPKINGTVFTGSESKIIGGALYSATSWPTAGTQPDPATMVSRNIYASPYPPANPQTGDIWIAWTA